MSIAHLRASSTQFQQHERLAANRPGVIFARAVSVDHA